MGRQKYPKKKFRFDREYTNDPTRRGPGYANGTPIYVQTFDHLRFWLNGDLVTKAQHDETPWEIAHASNNLIWEKST